MLRLEKLIKSFGGVTAVDGVSLSHSAGEMRAIIGPNGCGKTTVFNLITGYLRPDSGRVIFNDREIDGLAMHEVARLGIVRKFQVPSLFAGLTVPHISIKHLTANALPNGLTGIWAAIPFAIWFFLGIEGLANAADFPFGSDGYKPATPGTDVLDGIPFDARAPNA